MSGLRVALAQASIVVVAISPSQSTRHYLLLAVLLLYAAYSIYLMLRADQGSARGIGSAYWLDAACYLLVLGSSVELDSVPFAFLFFPVLAASLQEGFRRGVLVSGVCAVMLVFIGVMHADPGTGAGQLLLSLWPVAVFLLIGLAIAQWGNTEFRLMRESNFLNNISSLATKQHSMESTLDQFGKMFCVHYRIDSCVLILGDSHSDRYLLRESRSTQGRGFATVGRIREGIAERLLAPSPRLAMICNRRLRFPRGTTALAYHHASLEPRSCTEGALEELANLLDTDSFITLPIHALHGPVGRLYLTSRRFRFDHSDLCFLQQVVRQAGIVVENVQLREQLATEAANQERRKISRDLHDGTIQPYLGLKLGLEALRRRVPDDSPCACELVDLAKMAGEGIKELREYAASLRRKRAEAGYRSLLFPLQQEASRFQQFYGIDVQVVADSDLRLQNFLFAEVMNIVREGLANARRHSSARHVVITLRQEDAKITIRIENDGETSSQAATLFYPRSLNERASELGGRVDVQRLADGRTSVAVEIPA